MEWENKIDSPSKLIVVLNDEILTVCSFFYSLLKTGFLSIVLYYLLKVLLGPFPSAFIVGSLLIISSESDLIFGYSIDIFPIQYMIQRHLRIVLERWKHFLKTEINKNEKIVWLFDNNQSNKQKVINFCEFEYFY
jgi:hypothetical protein